MKFLWTLCLGILAYCIPMPAAALTLISPQFEVGLYPGQSESGLIKLYNEATDPVTVNGVVEVFSQGEAPGKPAYVPSDSSDDHTTWFSLQTDELVLAPGQVAAIPFTISVPDTAVPGGYYAAIYWQTQHQDVQSGVAISGRVGALVFLTVLGDITESADISVTSNQGIVTQLPVTINASINNTGTIHIRPDVTAIIKNMFGKVTVIELNQTRSSILPGTARQFNALWESAEATWWDRVKAEFRSGALGPITITVQADFGSQEPQRITATTDVVIIPYRMSIIIVVGIVMVILFFRVNRYVSQLKSKHRNETK